ncbi:MAG: AmmeMemoRadiSam system protein B [Candidatus Andersenbacteria bacterium RIFCSPLOWO2_12_FULL_45_8]|nr:MAG: AmmeMemoRadiSam system protein B [Candidatus Andersenbacteria bacterium RIFCSPHIGHO2_02_FULL_46_16]OGY41166.1 MAG: AmmeMemoRadiSam system protein B [Candidatus Andersenbacteria bacterium RIFCSPLOWO2_12_FULL_45_8]OGY82010.1 MAG: AmmeMemoRadiSam system protein B [Candidatus Kerfeldbacteria bacterium RIFCSPHIGHO2_12_FULL_42_13]OGY84266.1 MAG: AmmeMemoRadiSam system protein B [Candidatus Kerfeldbacteria bacterium RIFCSPLOWO2_02_FULL_42_19]
MHKFSKFILILVSFCVGYFGIATFFNSQPHNTPDKNIDVVVGGIVPHHLVADEIIQKLFTIVGNQNPKTIILVSPDHWGVAKSNFTTTAKSNFGGVLVDTSFRGKLINELPSNIEFDDELLNHEHGVTGLVPYIKKLSPQTKIVPIAVSAITSKITLDKISHFLSKTDSNVVIIASSDFSHYLPSLAADLHDSTSIAVISAFDRSNFRNLEVDCWQCLYIVSSVSELKNAKKSELVGHSNSAKLSTSENTAPETTSYVGLVFRESGQNSTDSTATLLSVGDIMLGRYVETLMNSAGENYPFEKISQFLRGIDIVSGNLEGTIITDHKQTPDFSTKFSFSPRVAKTLRLNNFSLVSLANNHALDYGENGLKETSGFLKQFEIDTSGHPSKIEGTKVATKDVRGQKIAFASFNFTGPYPKEQEAYELVKNFKEKNNFVVVNIHWSEEYALKANDFQKIVAHNLIDSGADLIIGHHPHVVQEIEQYKNKIIFYSLGNFIFDQYFSKYTKEGLTIGTTLNDQEVIYRLFPINIVQSQPSLMTGARAQEWLGDLSTRSDSALIEEIKSGMIVVPRN